MHEEPDTNDMVVWYGLVGIISSEAYSLSGCDNESEVSSSNIFLFTVVFFRDWVFTALSPVELDVGDASLPEEVDFLNFDSKRGVSFSNSPSSVARILRL